jgi:polygalacturonase
MRAAQLALAATLLRIARTLADSGSLNVVRGDRIAVATLTECNVMHYGAAGDGKHNDTAALQAAISACASRGSSTVVFPAGHTFLTYPLVIDTTANLSLSIQGTIVFAPDREGWPGNANCLTASKGTVSLALTGGGVVNGSGSVWWEHRDEFRPTLFRTEGVTELLVANLTWADSPYHTLEIYGSDVEVVDTTIVAPPDPVSHNTDGIDLHGSPFWVHRCNISTGDDNVAIHSSHVLVEECAFGAGHGASIGSLSGKVDLANITVRNCSFQGTTQAVRIKADETCQGSLSGVEYSGLGLQDVGTSIIVTMFYSAEERGNPSLLRISNVTLADIEARNSHEAGQFLCQKESPCTGFVMRDVRHVGTLSAGFECKYVEGVAKDVTPPVCFA